MTVTSLYDKYGGASTVEKLVEDFYRRVLDSERLAAFFDGVSMPALRKHQTAFLSYALGGPNAYQGRSLEAAHRQFFITSEDFDEVAMLLKQTLEGAGVEAADIEAILKIVGGTRDQVVRPSRMVSTGAADGDQPAPWA